MNFEQKHALAALIVVTLVASGCASGGSSNGNKQSSTTPISINEFSAFPNPAPTNQKVTFTLALQNTGSGTARNVVAKLANPPFADSKQDDRVWRSYNGDVASAGKVTESYRTFDFGDLEANQGDFATSKTISMLSPNVPKTFPYHFHAKIHYQYTTNGTTTITVMNSKKFQNSGQSRTNDISIDTNSAPISLNGYIDSGNPVVYYPGQDGSTKKFNFCVNVKNVGPGQVFHGASVSGSQYTIDDQDENKVKVKMISLGNTKIKKEGGSNYGRSASNTVELVGGDKARQCFNMKITDLTSSMSQREIGPIQIQASYGYTKTTKNKVTVNPR